MAFQAKSISSADRKKWIGKFYGAKYVNLVNYDEQLWPACWLLSLGEGGIAVGRCSHYDTERKEDITADYFDRDLNLLGKIKIPYFKRWNEPGQGQLDADWRFMFRGDRLFTLEERNEENWIVRWDVKIEKN